MIRYALFDLDDTLYPPAAGLMKALGRRMTSYMIERLDMSPERAESLRETYNRQYGSTTRGLVLHHGVDVVEFLDYAHDLPVNDYLASDSDLGCLLDCIRVEKCVFTNAPQFYAEQVLGVLDIKGRFSEVFALELSDYRGKPDEIIYEKIEARLNVEGQALIMLDDALKNLVPAKRRNWITVWVNGGKGNSKEVDYVVNDLWQVAHVFHQLGILDEAHRDEWHRCLTQCPLGQRQTAAGRHQTREHNSKTVRGR